MNITEPIRRHAVLRPEAIAVIRPDHRAITYRALDGIIDALAARLSELGAEPGMVAGLSLAGPDEFPGLTVALAMARLGVATADMTLPAEQQDLCCPEHGRAGPTGVPSLPVADLCMAVPPAPEEVPPGPIHRDGGALCRIFATSGTTGRSKFVPADHALISGRILGKLIAQGERDDVHVCAAGPGGAMGFQDVLRSLFAGGTLVLARQASVDMAITRHRVNSMLMSPLTLGQLVAQLADRLEPFPSLVEIEVSGGALPGPLRTAAERKLCRNIVEVYGASETHVIASAPSRLMAGREGAVGLAHPGVRVEATDESGVPLPPGEVGRLRVGGPYVATGYYRDPDATQASFADGWFLTDDVGAVTADGWVVLQGRKSEVINAGGVKIGPAAIEEVLLAQTGVRDAAAFGMEDAFGVTQIWAAVVVVYGADLADIAAGCRRQLGERAPRFLLPLENVPRNANGKILRQALVDLARLRSAD